MPSNIAQPPIAGATVLDEVPGRALEFLRAIANSSIVYSSLAAAGFKIPDYEEGWNLLHAASGYTPNQAPPPEKSPAYLAMQELDAWDEDGFRRIRAGLERLHPEQAAFVFAGGLAAATGAASVLAVGMLLERLDELESGKDRKATRKEDQAALRTLEGRGFDKEERDRLAALVKTARSMNAPAELPTNATKEERQQALVKLYGWYKDWAETARSVVKKRSHLITLGLAKRKSPKKGAPAKPAGGPGTP